jgi:hypothetical protein
MTGSPKRAARRRSAFEVIAMNWTRSAWELSDEELTTAGDILGHPVTQIHTHY